MLWETWELAAPTTSVVPRLVSWRQVGLARRVEHMVTFAFPNMSSIWGYCQCLRVWMTQSRRSVWTRVQDGPVEHVCVIFFKETVEIAVEAVT